MKLNKRERELLKEILSIVGVFALLIGAVWVVIGVGSGSYFAVKKHYDKSYQWNKEYSDKYFIMSDNMEKVGVALCNHIGKDYSYTKEVMFQFGEDVPFTDFICKDNETDKSVGFLEHLIGVEQALRVPTSNLDRCKNYCLGYAETFNEPVGWELSQENTLCTCLLESGTIDHVDKIEFHRLVPYEQLVDQCTNESGRDYLSEGVCSPAQD